MGEINDGEKVGEGFIIEVSGQELGYVMPNKEDKRRIGNITIQSAEDVTEEGIKVGDMFKDALTKYPNLKVKRGGNGKKVYIKVGRLAFLLDLCAEGKSVSIKEIPETTVILELKILLEKIGKRIKS